MCLATLRDRFFLQPVFWDSPAQYRSKQRERGVVELREPMQDPATIPMQSACPEWNIESAVAQLVA